MRNLRASQPAVCVCVCVCLMWFVSFLFGEGGPGGWASFSSLGLVQIFGKPSWLAFCTWWLLFTWWACMLLWSKVHITDVSIWSWPDLFCRYWVCKWTGGSGHLDCRMQQRKFHLTIEHRQYITEQADRLGSIQFSGIWLALNGSCKRDVMQLIEMGCLNGLVN